MRFGKINVPDWALWLAGLGIPAAAATVYHYFHADRSPKW